MKANNARLWLFWFVILLVACGFAVGLLFSEQESVPEGTSPDEVMNTLSNRFQHYDSLSRRFEEGTSRVGHLQPVKAAQTRLKKKRDEAFVRLLQETVDRSLPGYPVEESEGPDAEDSLESIGKPSTNAITLEPVVWEGAPKEVSNPLW